MFFKKAGEITSLKDGIATVAGLQEVGSGELVVAGRNVGLVLNLLKDSLGVVFFTELGLKVGDLVRRTKRLPTFYVSLLNLGEVFTPLSVAIAERTSHFRSFRNALTRFISLPAIIETKAPGILARQSVYEPVPTGIKIVDSLIPVGQGQRELIIGDRQTGKTAIAIDTILSQSKFARFFF